jgi:hypothetical protein
MQIVWNPTTVYLLMILMTLMVAEHLIKHDWMIISDNRLEYKPLIGQ